MSERGPSQYSKFETDPIPGKPEASAAERAPMTLPSEFETTARLATEFLDPTLTPDDLNEGDLTQRFELPNLRTQSRETHDRPQVDTLPGGWRQTTFTASSTEGATQHNRATIVITHPDHIGFNAQTTYSRDTIGGDLAVESATRKANTVTPLNRVVTHEAHVEIGKLGITVTARTTEDGPPGGLKRQAQELIKDK